ncbi:MAG TPA: thioesterase family protein [Mycobacteriales bacterium]|nr:thioesterase family protein [Mycobacteriales bacterium]
MTAATTTGLGLALRQEELSVLDGVRRTRAQLDRTWWSWSGPHGGLLAALALGAARGVVGADRQPQVVSAQFLAAAGDRPLELAATVLRAGGSSDVVRVDTAADGAPVLTSTVTLARPRPGGTRWDGVRPPAARPPQSCEVVDPTALVPFAQHVEIRRAGPGPLVGGEAAELLAWVRLRDEDRAVDAEALVVLADALAPGLYGIATAPVPVPTVDLTVTLGPGPAAPGWTLVRIRTRTAADGWCVDDSDVWAPDGRLVAQARQTRRVLGEVRP